MRREIDVLRRRKIEVLRRRKVGPGREPGCFGTGCCTSASSAAGTSEGKISVIKVEFLVFLKKEAEKHFGCRDI